MTTGSPAGGVHVYVAFTMCSWTQIYFSAQHGDRDRLLRFDIDMNVSGLCPRLVRRTGVIVPRVQAYGLIVAGDPVERLLLAERWRRQGARKEQGT